MNVGFEVMMQTASEKYTNMVDTVYKAKNGEEVDYDKLISLIHSVYMDEVELITNLHYKESNMQSSLMMDAMAGQRILSLILNSY